MMNHSIANKFGFIPSFTIQDGKEKYTSLLSALEASPVKEFDFEALNIYFRTGLFLNGQTPFYNIHRVLPPPIIIEQKEYTHSQAIDAYDSLFRQAVNRCLQPSTVIALSGGRDSRHILLELNRIKSLPQYAMTVCIPGRTEEKITTLLTNRIGIPLRLFVSSRQNAVEDELLKNLYCDFSTEEHGWSVCMIKQRNELPIWDGIGGDVLSAGLFLNGKNLQLYTEKCLYELANELVFQGPLPFVRNQSLYPVAPVIEAIKKELEVHIDAANPFGSFYFWNRTRVQIAPSAFKLFSPKRQQTLTPYLDKDLWGFLSSIPAKMLLDYQFHTNVIKKYTHHLMIFLIGQSQKKYH